MYAYFSCPHLQTVFEEMQLQQYESDLKLKQMASHRWSSADGVMERFLRLWVTIKSTLREQDKPFPLEKKRQELLEVYGVLHATTNIIKATQSSNVTGPLFLTSVCQMMATELNTRVALKVHDPTPLPSEEGAATVVNNVEFRPRLIAANNLTGVGKKTRQKLGDAIKSRLIDPRYSSEGGMKSSYLWDAAALAHPDFVDMKWIDLMTDSTGEWHARAVIS